VDLVRLATSVHLAIAASRLTLQLGQACKLILSGYSECLAAGGEAFVFGERHPALREMAVARLKDPKRYWDKLHTLPTLDRPIPSSALKGLRGQLPEAGLELRIAHRIAGLGSLGRRRYLALAHWRGASVAREAKELTISAWRWAQSRKVKGGIFYQEIVDRSIRCPDPFVRQQGRWILRRLAPDCSRIELSSLPAKHDASRLLQAMGWETANVHLGSCEARVLSQDLRRRGPRWLHAAALKMVRSTLEDWEEWRKS
jgi:hypothetical protein